MDKTVEAQTPINKVFNIILVTKMHNRLLTRSFVQFARIMWWYLFIQRFVAESEKTHATHAPILKLFSKLKSHATTATPFNRKKCFHKGNQSMIAP